MIATILPDHDDKLMWDIWMSIYHAAVVSAADELGIFQCLGSHYLSATQIAEKLQISIRAVEALADTLTALRFLEKSENIFSLSAASREYLLPYSPFYWGPVFEGLGDRTEHKKIVAAIKSGTNQLTFQDKTFTDMWKDGNLEPDAAKNFTRNMHATIFAPASHT